MVIFKKDLEIVLCFVSENYVRRLQMFGSIVINNETYRYLLMNVVI